MVSLKLQKQKAARDRIRERMRLSCLGLPGGYTHGTTRKANNESKELFKIYLDKYIKAQADQINA